MKRSFIFHQGGAEALWLGLQVAGTHDWSQVLFEGNSSIVMDTVNRNIVDCPWQIEPVVSLIKERLAQSPSYCCSLSARCVNVAAHTLAQWAASSQREGCFPDFCGHHQRLPWIYEGFDPP